MNSSLARHNGLKSTLWLVPQVSGMYYDLSLERGLLHWAEVHLAIHG